MLVSCPVSALSGTFEDDVSLNFGVSIGTEKIGKIFRRYN